MSPIEKIKLKNNIKNTIKIICSLPPDRPTNEELANILDGLSEIENFDEFDRADLRQFVHSCVGKTKKHVYEGLDNSDVLVLLRQISEYLEK